MRARARMVIEVSSTEFGRTDSFEREIEIEDGPPNFDVHQEICAEVTRSFEAVLESKGKVIR